jgi:hypothetical protein
MCIVYKRAQGSFSFEKILHTKLNWEDRRIE